MQKQTEVDVRDLNVGDVVLHPDTLAELRVTEVSHAIMSDMTWLELQPYWRDGSAKIATEMGGWERLSKVGFVVQSHAALDVKKVADLRTELRLMLRDGTEPRPTGIGSMRKAEIIGWIEQIEAAEATARAACDQAWEEDDAEFDN